MKLGAIDIGTNAARLLIGEIETNSEGFTFVKKVSYTRVPLRLGMDVFEKGKITSRKKDDFIKTIKAFQLIADVFNVKDLRACATSAMREANNGKEVQKEIRKETGIDIEIIDGNEESKLVFSAFFLLEIEKNTPFVVIDVGGGSTEVSVFQDGEKIAAKSFKIGTIRLIKGKVSKTIWQDINDWLKKNTDTDRKYRVFGIGGNINKVHKLLGKRDMQSISYEEIQGLHDMMLPMSVEKRIKKFQLKEDRADVIVPAISIYAGIMSKVNAKKMYVPKIGLADGIIYGLYQNIREAQIVRK